MVMTMVVDHAWRSLDENDKNAWSKKELATLLYADDTLLTGRNAHAVERLLMAVARAGATFGMVLHADKFQLLQINSDTPIRDPNGRPITAKNHIKYLGTMVSADGTIDGEVTCRCGNAKRDFNTLTSVWRHSNLTRQQKIAIFNAVIITKLTYGFATCWLNAAQRRKLDRFQNRCLRQIWGIPAAFVSRTSNTQAQEKLDKHQKL